MTTGSAGLIPAIDFPILRGLPKQGTNVGLRPIAVTVKGLMQANPEWGLNPQELSGRLKSLRFLGLAVDVVVLPTGQGRGWQITPAGEHLLKNEGK